MLQSDSFRYVTQLPSTPVVLEFCPFFSNPHQCVVAQHSRIYLLGGAKPGGGGPPAGNPGGNPPNPGGAPPLPKPGAPGKPPGNPGGGPPIPAAGPYGR